MTYENVSKSFGCYFLAFCFFIVGGKGGHFSNEAKVLSKCGWDGTRLEELLTTKGLKVEGKLLKDCARASAIKGLVASMEFFGAERSSRANGINSVKRELGKMIRPICIKNFRLYLASYFGADNISFK